MDTALFRYAEPPRTDIFVMWRETIRGDKDARAILLRRIMRPQQPGVNGCGTAHAADETVREMR